jgi:hypothetical protein
MKVYGRTLNLKQIKRYFIIPEFWRILCVDGPHGMQLELVKNLDQIYQLQFKKELGPSPIWLN